MDEKPPRQDNVNLRHPRDFSYCDATCSYTIQHSSWVSHNWESINRNLFPKIDFAPAFVKDRPNPENIIEATEGLTENTSTPEDKTPTPSPSILTLEPVAFEPEELSIAALFVQQPAINLP